MEEESSRAWEGLERLPGDMSGNNSHGRSAGCAVPTPGKASVLPLSPLVVHVARTCASAAAAFSLAAFAAAASSAFFFAYVATATVCGKKSSSGADVHSGGMGTPDANIAASA